MDLLKQLKQQTRKRQSTYDTNKWGLTDWGNALAGETGELCNIIKKIHRGDFTLEEANKDEILADEAADIVIYLDLLCQHADIDLSEAIVRKFNRASDKIGTPDVKLKRSY